jgi:hypothetical protein
MALLAVACGSANHASTVSATPSAAGTASASTSYPTSSYPSPIEASPTHPPPTYPSPTTASSARTGQCPAVQPAPQFPASTPSNRNLALVWLRGSYQYVVRDITDISQPATVSTFADLSSPRFVSATEVSGFGNNELDRLPLAGSRSVVAEMCMAGFAFAWSSDGTAAAYVTDLQTGAGSELHIVSGGQNRVASSMPGLPIGGCESWDCTDRLDLRLLYSPNGAYISLVQSWSGPVFRIWASDGGLIKSLDAGSTNYRALPSMSVWSGTGLYFRDPQGVEVWRDGRQSLVLPLAAWVRPKASPAGGQIVYMERDAYGEARVKLLDTTTNKVRELARSRSEPAFLTSRYLWYQGERPCATGDPYPCSAGAPTTPTGKTYLYNLQTGTETESIIADVWDVWPHPA